MKMHYAIFSGMFAATAGALGKISGHDMLKEQFLLQVICFGAMLACNAVVWTMFVKALHQSKSSLVATIISSTSNYLLTALLGYFLLGEVVSTFWWFGMLLILTGLSIIITDDTAQTELTSNKEC